MKPTVMIWERGQQINYVGSKELALEQILNETGKFQYRPQKPRTQIRLLLLLLHLALCIHLALLLLGLFPLLTLLPPRIRKRVKKRIIAIISPTQENAVMRKGLETNANFLTNLLHYVALG